MNKKYGIYLNAFIDTAKKYNEDINSKDARMYIKRAIYYGVKLINLKETFDKATFETVERDFEFASITKSLIGLLTPEELISIFPIDKVYDGKKYGTKDYFYTMDYISKLDPKEPIGADNVLDLLWEYVNSDLRRFSVNIMGYMSKLRQLEGYPSIMDEWMDMNGIEGPTLHQDHKGNNFLINKQGKVLKAAKPRPKYLRVVK